jgi:hypothetical protein
MIESPAMAAASLSARRVLDRLEIEMAHHGGTDNGRLPVTFSNFEDFGIDRHAIAPAIRECVVLGFVEVVEQGKAGNREFRSPSLYRLTYRHTDRADPTNEWRRISTIKEAQTLARDARSKKQKTSGGKRTISVGKTHTENADLPVGETHTTAPVGENRATIYISGKDPTTLLRVLADARAKDIDAESAALALAVDLSASCVVPFEQRARRQPKTKIAASKRSPAIARARSRVAIQ